MSVVAVNRHKMLEELLLALFGADELRRFVRHGPFGAEVERELPSRDVSAVRLAESVVQELEKRSLIEPELWGRLKGERPRRAAEIETMAKIWRKSPEFGTPGATPASDDPEYLIATALGLEYQAVARLLRPNRTFQRTSTGTALEIGTLARTNSPVRVALVETGHGNDDAGLVVSDVLGYLPKLKGIVFVGIAGGVKDVKLGDVVASDRVYAYEYGKDAKSFMPRPHLGNAAYRLLQRARVVSRGSEWLNRSGIDAEGRERLQAFVGPIAAGSKVVASQHSTVARLIQEHYSDTLALEMEGYGTLRAAWLRGTDAIVIRGISDLLGNKAKTDKAGWQLKAAAHAAAFAAEMLADM